MTNIFFGLLIASFFVLNQDWEFHSEKNGIKLYQRDKEGSPLKETRTESLLPNTNFKAIRAAFNNIDGHLNWIYGAVEVELLEKKENSLLIYYVIEAPWPVSDRDLVMNYEFREEGDQMIIDVSAKPDGKPETKDYVRIPQSDALWTLNKKGGNVHLVNVSSSHPGGSIPGWLANMSSSETPFYTIEKLLEELKKY